jgi:hypothetical protein
MKIDMISPTFSPNGEFLFIIYTINSVTCVRDNKVKMIN